MRAFTRLLYATPSNIGSVSSLTEALALLPPIPLYRRILRVHRKKLDPEMRILGDSYVKSEFRAHRSTENPLHIVRYPVPVSRFGLWFAMEGFEYLASEANEDSPVRRSGSLRSGNCMRRSWRGILGLARS